MNRGDVGLVLGLAGFLLGGVAIYVAYSHRQDVLDIKNERVSDNENIGALGGKVDQLDRSLKDAVRRMNGMDVDARPLLERMRRLEERLDAGEKAAPKDGDAAAGTGAAKPPAKDDRAQVEAEIAELGDKFMRGEASPDAQARFWKLLREHPEVLDGKIAALEKDVEANPRDIDKRMELARKWYLLKLLSVPDGPERGAWSLKSIGEYKKVLEIDPDHWGARFHLAFNYSQWPDFLNKTPDAIKEFETLRKVQERQTPDPEHAQTYLQLSKLYQKTGKADLAKEALDEGLRRFPDDEELQKARDGAK